MGNTCLEILNQAVEQLKSAGIDRPRTNAELLLVTIARSPSCSSGEVYWGKKVIPGKGILVEELEERIKLNLLEFDFRRVSWSLERIEKYLKALG